LRGILYCDRHTYFVNISHILNLTLTLFITTDGEVITEFSGKRNIVGFRKFMSDLQTVEENDGVTVVNISSDNYEKTYRIGSLWLVYVGTESMTSLLDTLVKRYKGTNTHIAYVDCTSEGGSKSVDLCKAYFKEYKKGTTTTTTSADDDDQKTDDKKPISGSGNFVLLSGSKMSIFKGDDDRSVSNIEEFISKRELTADRPDLQEEDGLTRGVIMSIVGGVSLIILFFIAIMICMCIYIEDDMEKIRLREAEKKDRDEEMKMRNENKNAEDNMKSKKKKDD